MTMTERSPDFLDPELICSLRTESGFYVVGYLFTDEAAGKGVLKAVTDLYNQTAAVLVDGESTLPAKED